MNRIPASGTDIVILTQYKYSDSLPIISAPESGLIIVIQTQYRNSDSESLNALSDF